MNKTIPDYDNWNTRDFFKSATTEQVKACIAEGANIEARAERGFTPLHGAASQGNAETITALLEAGANAKARTKEGVIPLDLAKENDALQNTEAWWRLNDASYD